MIGCATRLIDTEAALHGLEPAWWDLWERCPAATPFQSPAWLLPWWTCFHPGTLRVIAVEAGGRLVALAPLYREDGESPRLLPLGMSISDYLDVLVDPAWQDEAGLALAGALGPERVDWEELAPGASALHFPCPGGWRDAVAPQSACPVLALAAGGGLPTAIPARRLRKVRMARHRAARRDVRIEAATAASAPGLIAHLFRLHGERWQARGESGVLDGSAVRRFHALAWPGLLGAGLLRLYAVSLDGGVTGVHYGFAAKGCAYAYLGGFDPAFAFESPGTLLMAHAIEEAMHEGAGTFHFLRGREAYKYEWGALDRWNSRRCMAPVHE